MTIENPSAADIRNLSEGDTIKVNGRKFTVTYPAVCFVGITGTRGGQATLIPSTCEKATQITTVSGQRDWIKTLEVL